MDLEPKVVEALEAELRRQAANGGLTASRRPDGTLAVQGRIQLDELAQAAIGAIAGGP